MIFRLIILYLSICLLAVDQSGALAADGTRGIAVEATPGKSAAPTAVPLPDRDDHNAGLFVGVNEFRYDKSIRPLNFAVDDAIAQAHLFILELKLLPPANCYLLLSGQPTGADTVKQLSELEKAGVQKVDADRSSLIGAVLGIADLGQDPSDLIIASFSTHGFEEAGEPYIMPLDGRRGALRETALSATWVEEKLRASKSGKRIMLIDACRERPLNDNSKSMNAGAMSRAFQDALAAAKGQAVLASCDVGQLSYENPSIGHGVFTYYLLEALRGQAAADDRGFIKLGAVSEYVSNGVHDWMLHNKPDSDGRAQTPWFKGPEEAKAIPLAVDAGVRTKVAAFKSSIDQVIDGLRLKITRHGSFNAQKYDEVASALERANLDAGGQDLLLNCQDFAAGRIREEPFIAYIEKLFSSAAGFKSDGPSAPAPAQPQDPVAALQSQAASGDAAAMYRMAELYLRGTGVERNESEAFNWYLKGAQAGNRASMTELGRMYFQNYLTGIDDAQAFRWLTKAADAGDPQAIFYLGHLTELGRGTTANLAAAAQLYAKAQPLLRESVGSGDARSMYALGMILFRGVGVQQESEAGLKLIRQSAEMGSANALLSLGMIYENGIHVTHDAHEAFKLYAKAAEMNSAEGMYRVAMLYAHGRGVSRDGAEAIKWFKSASDLGHPRAAFNVGVLYEEGIGVVKDEDEASRWFRSGIKSLGDAAGRGDAEAMFGLGQCYCSGWGVVKDEVIGRTWFAKAAERGNTQAMVRMGWVYATGQGVPQDDATAVGWYRKAAERGDQTAVQWLAARTAK